MGREPAFKSRVRVVRGSRVKLPDGWLDALRDEPRKPYFCDLIAFLKAERASKTVFPEAADVFRALSLTPLEKVNVVLLGQDPYHDVGQADGLCFSVRSATRVPPSLRNVFRELKSDLGIDVPAGRGDLSAWARQGVLLLNTVLTVVAHEPASHKHRGWETFTDAILAKVNQRSSGIVFCLWGAHARLKAANVDAARHVVLESAHPSPLSARRFFGSRPFSKINAALAASGRSPIDWSV